MADLSKPCVKCGAVDRYSDGACRPCKKARNAAYFQKNIEKLKESHRQWVQENKYKANAYKRTWASKNAERIKSYSEMYYDKNRTRILDQQKSSVARKLYAEYWRQKNPDKCLQYTKSWQQKNKSKVAEKWRRHKAKRRSIAGTPSPRIIERLIQYQRGLCACCGKELRNRYHLDHILPIALGGTSEDSNLQLLLPECNMKKGAKHPIAYMQSIGRLL